MPYTCNTCGEEFENRSLLGKHIHKEHPKPKKVSVENYGEVPDNSIEIASDDVKKVIIPIEAAEELQWIANGCPARLSVFGYKRPEGFVVEDVRYKP